MPDTDNTQDPTGGVELAQASSAFDQAKAQMDAAGVRRNEAILIAAERGLKYKAIAEITGLTVARVQQILDATRTGR